MESTEIVRIYTENQASVDVVWLSMPEWTTMREAVEEWLRRCEVNEPDQQEAEDAK